MEEHNLLDIPVINISENNKVNEYTMIHTTSGLPVYVPPDEKNNVEVFKIYEFVFLPITHHDFKHNTEDLFFGFRILIHIEYESEYKLVGEVMACMVSVKINYEITRIRYYPYSNTSIVIDKSYDSLYPTQSISIKGPESPCIDALYSAIGKIINTFCNFYYNKEV